MSNSDYCPHCGAPVRPHTRCEYCAYITNDNGAGVAAIPHNNERQPIKTSGNGNRSIMSFVTLLFTVVYCVLGIAILFLDLQSQTVILFHIIILALAAFNFVYHAIQGNKLLTVLNMSIVFLKIFNLWLLS